jgi:hypothetical protein
VRDVGAVGDADANDGRVGAEVVVGAEGRGVKSAVLVHAGDESDRAWSDQADQQVVDLSWLGLFDIERHRVSIPVG